MSTESPEKLNNKKQGISKGNQLAHALFVFFALFNLLSFADLWEVVLEPVGWHLLLQEHFPKIYQSYESKFIRYTDAPDRYLVMYSWNFLISWILIVLFFASYFVLPNSRAYVLGLFYPKDQNDFQRYFGPVLTLFVGFVLLDGPGSPHKLGDLLYYSGFISFVIMAFFMTLLSTTALSIAVLVDVFLHKLIKFHN